MLGFTIVQAKKALLMLGNFGFCCLNLTYNLLDIWNLLWKRSLEKYFSPNSKIIYVLFLTDNRISESKYNI
ncbi:MAG: hypothetical protein F6K17_11025 [Okeania sp. SIO3C4]|nr:hypothetical protein [Okeania sp. SIO3B3]NER03117.1 hypothetical protein [Okeania sp. SIO3C4]